MSQCDDVAIGVDAKVLVIEFNQDKFEEMLAKGAMSPVSSCKQRKITFVKKNPTEGLHSQTNVSILQEQSREPSPEDS